MSLSMEPLTRTEKLVGDSRSPTIGTRGVVVSGHDQASAAGLKMFERGGNAIDAGVATVLAQAVVEFHDFGFGGEVPILMYVAKE